MVRGFSDKTNEEIKKTCEEFVDDTTCHGVGGFAKAKSIVLKCLWICALCLAFGMMSRQVVILVVKYYSYGKITKVEVRNGPQDFPTISICNMNPYLRSAVVKSRDPSIQKLRAAFLELKREEDRKPVRVAFRGKRSATTSPSPAPLPTTVPPPVLLNNVPSIQYDLIDIVEKKPTDRLLREALQMAGMQVPSKTMTKFGQRPQDMVHWCRFLGHDCSYKNFSHFLSYEYGNCYSFNSADLRDKAERMGRSGKKYGLGLILNVQKDEYLPVLSSGTGLHVVIHGFGTKAFPVHEGYTIPAGFETNFGITIRNIERLGKPYGKCRPTLLPTQNESNAYTVTSCVSQCVHLAVLDRCGCYRYGAKAHLPADRARDAKPCTMDEDIRCYLTVNQDYAQQNFECDCLQPCLEVEYSATSDLNEWPSDGYLKVLEDIVCRNEAKFHTSKTCDKIKYKGRHFVRDNFLVVTVYFKQLNYERIVEETEYEIEDLLSDVGGTLGLYAGISLLTGMEILALIGRLIHIIMSGMSADKQDKRKHTHKFGYDNKTSEQNDSRF